MSDKIVCPNCRNENPSENLFCQSCGMQLNADSQPKPALRSQQPSSFQYNNLNSPPQPGSQVAGTLRIDKLGRRLDGWAELIEGAADKTGPLRDALHGRLQAKRMPEVGLRQTELTPGGLVGKRRTYHLSQNYSGATLATYVGTFGTDLYLAWDVYLAVVIKWINILVMAIIAGVLAIIPANGRYGFEFGTWILAWFGWMVPIGLGALVLGQVLRGDRRYFFMEIIDTFVADDITALMLAVHKSMLAAIDEVGLDSSLLRIKEHFVAGRRERII